MKFAQFLNEHAVPEWKTQYLDYKQGKKKLKKFTESPIIISTPLSSSISHRPNNPGRKSIPRQTPEVGDSLQVLKQRKPTASQRNSDDQSQQQQQQQQYNQNNVKPTPQESVRTAGNRSSLVSFQLPPPAMHGSPDISYTSTRRSQPQQQAQHQDEEAEDDEDEDEEESEDSEEENDRTPLLSPEQQPQSHHNRKSSISSTRPPEMLTSTKTTSAIPQTTPRNYAATASSSSAIMDNDDIASKPPTNASPMSVYDLSRRRSRIESFVKTIKDMTSTTNVPGTYSINSSSSQKDHELASYNDFAKQEFLEWCDAELMKVESFYRDNEKRSMERFFILESQVSQLLAQRGIRKLKEKQARQQQQQQEQEQQQQQQQQRNEHGYASGSSHVGHNALRLHELKLRSTRKMSKINRFELPSLPALHWIGGKERAKEYYEEGFYSDDDEQEELAEEEEEAREAHRNKSNSSDTDEDSTELRSTSTPTPTSDAAQVPTKSKKIQDQRFNRRDYTRMEKLSAVPYYVARRQLKTAMLELYRSLELLKSFKLVNRTAFRKILKKFDKTTQSSFSADYMTKVDNCYFYKSEAVDEIVSKLEEIYANTFENGNRKSAVTKLRSSEVVKTFYTESFMSGCFIGISFPLFVLALYKALHDTLRGILAEGRFLLQIWAGIFLMTLLSLLFALNCAIWTRYKINYKFIFEFNPRTSLDYKQFLLLPSLSLLLLSFFSWFSFENFWPTRLPARFWPWFYVAIMTAIMVCPFRIFFYPSRTWLLTSVWRLLASGFYPVEFRDFFLGDIFCSLTYSLSNISFFFCLYATHWDGTLTGGNTKCGSQSSRLMGFLATVPSIWRFMQCIRRFSDTGDWFPHLANCAKYTISLIYYMLLSIYRIDRTVEHKAIFIVFAAINSIYSSIWDIFMDWSLMEAGSKNFLLRDDLIFKNAAYYYVAMIVDVILRFQWIFYAFFARQVQQSAVTSFCIALAEVLRRFIWIFFRLENEHCTNIHLFKASRETPLPYPVEKNAVRKKMHAYQERMKSIQVAMAPIIAPSVLDEEAIIDSTSRRPSAVASVHEIPIHHTNTEIAPSETTEVEGMTDAPASSSAAQRRVAAIGKSIARFSRALNSAHVKDFQRRKVKPEDKFITEEEEEEAEDSDGDDEDSDEDENGQDHHHHHAHTTTSTTTTHRHHDHDQQAPADDTDQNEDTP